MSVYLAEWLKLKRSPIKSLPLITSIVFSILLVGYFSLREKTSIVPVQVCKVFLEVWSIMVIPMGIGILSGFMIHQEELAGGLNGLLGSKASRVQIYIGKFLMILLLTTISISLAIIIFVVGLYYIVGISLHVPIFIQANMMIQTGILPLIALHLWISLAWGMGASISVGGSGILLSALMNTSLGDKIWYYIPWGWPVRLSIVSLHSLSSDKNLPYLFDEMIKGMISVAVFFIILFIGGTLWFHRWEGRKVYD